MGLVQLPRAVRVLPSGRCSTHTTARVASSKPMVHVSSYGSPNRSPSTRPRTKGPAAAGSKVTTPSRVPTLSGGNSPPAYSKRHAPLK